MTWILPTLTTHAQWNLGTYGIKNDVFCDLYYTLTTVNPSDNTSVFIIYVWVLDFENLLPARLISSITKLGIRVYGGEILLESRCLILRVGCRPYQFDRSHVPVTEGVGVPWRLHGTVTHSKSRIIWDTTRNVDCTNSWIRHGRWDNSWNTYLSKLGVLGGYFTNDNYKDKISKPSTTNPSVSNGPQSVKNSVLWL